MSKLHLIHTTSNSYGCNHEDGYGEGMVSHMDSCDKVRGHMASFRAHCGGNMDDDMETSDTNSVSFQPPLHS